MDGHTPGRMTIEPHGDAHGVYVGRDSEHHGLRLMNLTDGDSNLAANAARIAAAWNAVEGAPTGQFAAGIVAEMLTALELVGRHIARWSEAWGDKDAATIRTVLAKFRKVE